MLNISYASYKYRFCTTIGVILFLFGCNMSNNEGNSMPHTPLANDIDAWVTASNQSALLQKQNSVLAFTESLNNYPVIDLEPSTSFQTIDGFGYTLTGGSAMLLRRMSSGARKDILRNLFGCESDNICLSYLRLSMGASDLDETVFSYNDLADGEEDLTLSRFNLANDTVNLIPLLKEIIEYGGTETAASLNSTIFLYGDQSANVSVVTTPQYDGESIIGDFNADGKSDILASTYYYDNFIKYSNGYKIFLDPQSTLPLYQKTLAPGHTVVENKKLINFLAGDYNRDGIDDVVSVKTKIVTYPSGYSDRVAERFIIDFTTATGSLSQEMPMPPGDKIIHPSGNFFIPGDFDGDGNQDYITIYRVIKIIAITMLLFVHLEKFLPTIKFGNSQLRLV